MNKKNANINNQRTYLNYVISVLKFDVLTCIKEIQNLRSELKKQTTSLPSNLDLELKKVDTYCLKSTQALRDSIALLMILSEDEWTKEISMNQFLDNTIKSLYFDLKAENQEYSISFNPPPKDILVKCEEQILQSVVYNLFFLTKNQFSDSKAIYTISYESGFATITLKYKGERHQVMNLTLENDEYSQQVNHTEFNNPYTILKHMEKLGLGVLSFSNNEKYNIINFTLHLATKESETPKPRKVSSIQEHNWKDKTVLIVDDIEVNYIFLETILADTKVKTLYASNGQIAVEMCRKHKEIDAVLMDIKMPVMDGYEATKIIKQERPDLPIIIQTAYSFNEEYERCKELGCNDYITKPLKSENVISVLAKYFID